MTDEYMNLKSQLDALGYNNHLPVDGVPLVECILADLLQTTHSLQHYMEVSTDVLKQRDSLVMEAEPYKRDNVRLIQENNELYTECMQLKEEILKINKEKQRKLRSLSDELSKKDVVITKLQHEIRDLGFRGLCATTQSSRNKINKKIGSSEADKCVCIERKSSDNEVIELNHKVQALEELFSAYKDEISLLKSQVEYRDKEITRLKVSLEGRPLNKGAYSDSRLQELLNYIHDLESRNKQLKLELDASIEKQHEAMLKALDLADKNKILHEELKKMDALALKVEENCNSRISILTNELDILRTKLESSNKQCSQLQAEINTLQSNSLVITKLKDSFNTTTKEKESLQTELKDSAKLNKVLQEQFLALSEVNSTYIDKSSDSFRKHPKHSTNHDLKLVLDTERKIYEKHIVNIQEKITDTLSLLNHHIMACSDKKKSTTGEYDNVFIRDLHNKLCEGEQKILMLKKENDEIQCKMLEQNGNYRNNYKDIINQLNEENVQLSKENINLSQQLNQYKHTFNIDEYRSNAEEIIRNKDKEIKKLTGEIQVLKKDKHEYNLRCKNMSELVEKYKMDLILKDKDIVQLQEENYSYKFSQRTDMASSAHLREECKSLREQLKNIQCEVIKEKSISNQVKNIQLETERSSNEMQNEIVILQKRLSQSMDTIDSLQQKCDALHSEIISLKKDKTNLLDSIRRVDQERDKLVVELDNKTEEISHLEQNLKSQCHERNKLVTEVLELNRKLERNTMFEHKYVDSHAQLEFLNAKISRLTHQFDTATDENKHLQNSLADANSNLQLARIEYEKRQKELDEVKQQLQHYVDEIRRIEELLSRKETERTDMLENFASLSVEANMLETTNNSLENESASKSLKLQTFTVKLQELESRLLDKDNIIENQKARINDMICKITALENEIKLVNEEKKVYKENVEHLKQMCSDMQSEQKDLGGTDSELKLYEHRIKDLTTGKSKLDIENNELKQSLKTTEHLLTNARKEIIDLKLTLQDATSETKHLHERVKSLSSREERLESFDDTKKDDADIPLVFKKTIHEVTEEEDDESSSYHSYTLHKTYSKYAHHTTL